TRDRRICPHEGKPRELSNHVHRPLRHCRAARGEAQNRIRGASPASRVRRNPKEPPHPLAPGLHSSGAGVFAASPKPITDSFNSRKRKFTMSAKTHEFETTDIPLKKLLAWNENVRITSSDQGIDE